MLKGMPIQLLARMSTSIAVPGLTSQSMGWLMMCVWEEQLICDLISAET